MAMFSFRRTPSISAPPDEILPKKGRLQKRESFAIIKGAVHLLEDGKREDHDEESSPSPATPVKEGDGKSDIQRRQLHAMIEQLRPEDSIKLAVQLESVSSVRVRYLIIVSTLDKQESLLLGMDFPNSESDQCTVGLVLPVWSDTQVFLDGDGGFSITSAEETRIFKPVSMQTMWSVLQALHGCCERAVRAAVIPGNGLEWAQHYHQHIESDRLCLNEWEAMTDLESVRRDKRFSNEKLIRKHLRDIMRTEDLDSITCRMVHSALKVKVGFDLKPYKEYIDNEMMVIIGQMDNPSKIFDYLYLGSEWNAANFEELQKNNVGYILNVTREIDNFFPDSFTYMNIRVQDVETTDLLSHWTDTYNFINAARMSGQAVLVHCKMGISRSGSTVIAYAMKQEHWPLDVALAYVKDRRSIVKPNEGFMKQLQIYNGILNASQQRHSALWRRKSKDQRRKSLHKREESESKKEEEEHEEEDSDEGLEDEDEDEDELSTDDSHEDPEVSPSVNRSGRMTLFSLMQSISELDDVDQEQVNEAQRLRSLEQRKGSQGRRRLTHQRACVDCSPEPQRLPDAGQSKV
uniref:protein-serine/threonine phosphatase n=1 Tax=Mola mola TaxID=94237 RepID=A0A3Q3VRY2_MOLML